MAIASDPTIQIVFKGLVLAAITEGNPFAEVGALIDSPCHKAKLTVTKKTPGAADEKIQVPDGSSRISLEVKKTSRKKIETYKGLAKFYRAGSTGDPNDFRWFVDVETDLHPDRQYKTKKGRIKPIFRVNNALFYTRKRFEDTAELRLGEANKKNFGKLADEIAANIYLDTPESVAVLTIDGVIKMRADASDVKKGIRYVIDFDCHCGPPPPHSTISDFNTFYKALTPDTPQNKQVRLTKKPRPVQPGEIVHPFNDQVGCHGARLSRLSKL
ncbi:MAG: hypothetical protein WBV94_24470 [Blastocatellia bacterium]